MVATLRLLLTATLAAAFLALPALAAPAAEPAEERQAPPPASARTEVVAGNFEPSGAWEPGSRVMASWSPARVVVRA